MAITWGSWNSTQRLRTGVELLMSPSSVGPGTASVTITRRVYRQTYYASNENGSSDTWFLSGSGGSNAGNDDWSLGAMGYQLCGSDTFTVATKYGQAQTVTVTGTTKSFYAYPGVSTSASQSLTIPARPYSAPSTPSGMTRARNSDTSHTLSWTRNVSEAAPYDNLYLERLDTSGSSWAAVATLAGTATSYTDTGTVADKEYQWRVRARNSAGYSAYTTSATIKTTPAAPGTPTAAKDASGNITLSWPALSATTENVEVWHAANGTWDGAPLATLGRVTSYTHGSPNNTQAHKYRLRAKVSNPALVSAYSGDSNTVQLLAAPLAPTGLTPASTAVDASGPITFRWQHNPVDTTPQTKYQLRYRVNGGAWVDSGAVSSGTASRVLPGGTVANGATLEWQVMTWGSYATGSPWSSVATFPTSSPPAAVLNQPDDSGTWGKSRMIVKWGYSDPENHPPAAWTVVLQDASGSPLETKNGSGEPPPEGVSFSTVLADGGTYRVSLVVTDTTGMKSAPVVTTVTVVYAKPPAPVVVPVWHPEDGTVVLAITNPDPVGEQVPATSNTVWRSIDGGPWTLVTSGVPVDGVITDYIPGVGATNSYRVTALSDLPSSVDSGVASVVTEGGCFVYLNAGPDFSRVIRLRSNVKVDETFGRARVERRAAGRQYHVPHDGDQLTREFQISALVWNERLMSDRAGRASTIPEIEAFSVLPSPACYRDPDGRRVFVTVSPLTMPDLLAHAGGVSLTLSANGHREILADGGN